MKLMQEGQPPASLTYIAIEDAEATGEKVEAGGHSDHGADGRARLGTWRRSPTRRGLVRGLAAESTSALTWSTSPVPSLERAQHARPRRRQILLRRRLRLELRGQRDGGGWDLRRDPSSWARTWWAGCSTWPRRGGSRGGVAHWQVYFAVEDTDATIEKAKERGSNVIVSRSTSRPAASRSSPTPGAPASPRSRSAKRRRQTHKADPGRGGTSSGTPTGIGLKVGGRLRGVAGLPLVLPFGGLAEAGALHHLEAEHRALHPRRRDLDPEQVEDEIFGKPQNDSSALPSLLVGKQRGRRGGDRADPGPRRRSRRRGHPRRAESSRAARRRRTGWCLRTRGRGYPAGRSCAADL